MTGPTRVLSTPSAPRRPAPPPGREPAQAPGREPAQPPGREPAQAPGREPAQPPGREPAQAPGREPAQPPGREPAPLPGRGRAQPPAGEHLLAGRPNGDRPPRDRDPWADPRPPTDRSQPTGPRPRPAASPAPAPAPAPATRPRPAPYVDQPQPQPQPQPQAPSAPAAPSPPRAGPSAKRTVTDQMLPVTGPATWEHKPGRGCPIITKAFCIGKFGCVMTHPNLRNNQSASHVPDKSGGPGWLARFVRPLQSAAVASD